MIYATRDQLARFWGESTLIALADLDGDRVADAPLVDDALNRASGIVDSYISSRYALPLPVAPRVLEQPCADIAIYLIANDAGRVTDQIQTRYRDAIAWCKDVASGKANIVEIDDASNEDVAAGNAKPTAGWRIPTRF